MTILFFIGVDDYVKCFYCDGGLSHWEKEDDPWEEHMKWFSDCEFIRLMKNDATRKATITSTATKNSEIEATSSKPSTKTTPTPAFDSKPSANVKAIQVEPMTPRERDGVTIQSSSGTALPQSNTSVKPDADLSIVEKPATEIPNDSKTFVTSNTKNSSSLTTCTETCTIEASNQVTTTINENDNNSTKTVITPTQNTTCSESTSVQSTITTLEQDKLTKTSGKSNSSTSESSSSESSSNSSTKIINTSDIMLVFFYQFNKKTLLIICYIFFSDLLRSHLTSLMR
jgi:inhibitor of apoptosis protein 1 and 2, iap1, iap2, putative